MRAVIVELRGNYAAALSDDGCVRRLKNRGYAVGQEIDLQHTRKPNGWLRMAGVAAVAAVIVLPAYAYCAPYSYVSVDVNPSIEYSLNRFDRVLSYEAVNGDGAQVLEGLHLKGAKIQDALRLTIDAIIEDGYLTAQEPGGIVITASSKDEDKSGLLVETLAETAAQTVKTEAVEAEVDAEAVGQERVQKAKELGVTPGKLGLIEALQESAPDDMQINPEEWAHKPVKEIIAQTEQNKKAVSSAENAHNDSSSSSAGQGGEKQNSEDSDSSSQEEHGQGNKNSGNASSKANTAGKASSAKGKK